jgi:hypothetical protein
MTDEQLYRVGVDLLPGSAYVTQKGNIVLVIAVDDTGFWLLMRGMIRRFDHSSEFFVSGDKIVGMPT